MEKSESFVSMLKSKSLISPEIINKTQISPLNDMINSNNNENSSKKDISVRSTSPNKNNEIIELKKKSSQKIPSDITSPLNLEDLDISEEFASGSFGTLSLAVDKKTRSHKYAIKTISNTKKEVEEIMREIKIWKKLEKSEKTRSLPRYYNYFEEEINSKIRKTVEYHLVFDYFPQSLKDVIDDLKKKTTKYEDRFPFKKLVNFSKSLIHTLAYLQTFKICHRDLKPANLMVDEKWKGIFVIDFGESKVTRHYKTTKFSSIVGTREYISPELFKLLDSSDENLENLNFFKSDVFSFGLVLMELGILKLPKREKKERSYERNIEECIQEFEEVYKKEAKRKDLREELKFILEILRQSLNVYPEDRPDFKELFFKMMNMVEKDNFEKIREIILVSDKTD